MATPKRGDKIYRCFNGELEVYRFIREEIAPGATLPTWIMEDCSTLQKIQTDGQYYHTSRRKAYQSYLNECRMALPGLREHLTEAASELVKFTLEIARMEDAISELPDTA